MSLGLIVAMVLMIAIFSLIDYVDKNSNTSSAPDSSRGFNETVEGEFFDDAKYQDQMQVTEPQAKPLDQLTPEDVDPTLDPKYQETNAKNTFYHPLTEEQKREKEKIKKQRANKVGM